MSKEELIKKVKEAQELENALDESITKREVEQMIKDAFEVSKRYAEVLDRSAKREKRQEDKMISSTFRSGVIGFIMFFISSIMLYLCESTFKLEMETKTTTTILIVSAIVFAISCFILLATFIKHNNFYKTKYTISYKRCEDKGDGKKFYAYEYKTKSSSPEKALKRFCKVYGKDESVLFNCVRMTDEFGTKYDKKGLIVEC